VCVRACRTLFFILTLIFVTEIFALEEKTNGATFEVLTAVFLKSYVAYVVYPCWLVKRCRFFEKSYFFHLQVCILNKRFRMFLIRRSVELIRPRLSFQKRNALNVRVKQSKDSSSRTLRFSELRVTIWFMCVQTKWICKRRLLRCPGVQQPGGCYRSYAKFDQFSS
jgi:hypothetical protein